MYDNNKITLVKKDFIPFPPFKFEENPNKPTLITALIIIGSTLVISIILQLSRLIITNNIKK
jgi:hypothetical protein